MDNQAIYRTVEFQEWAEKDGLLDEERFLFSRYLDKAGKTLEAGTGGGRILLALRDNGFMSLYGFDYLPEFIYRAREKDWARRISFDIQDATDLSYEDEAFDQVLYLQQIMSMLEDEPMRRKAVEECYRTLRTGGIALFSFLVLDIRSRALIHRCYLEYLRVFRKFYGSTKTLQSLPWLRHAGKINLDAFRDVGPYVYWFRIDEIGELLGSAGFRIIAAGSSRQIARGVMADSLSTLQHEPLEGALYVVAMK